MTDEEKKVEDIAKDHTKCNHVGAYHGYGFEIVPTTDGTVIGISAIVCMMCGAVFTPVSIVKPTPDSKPPESKILHD